MRPVGVHAHHLAGDQVIELVAGFLTEGLAEVLAVGDLRGVNAEQANGKLCAVRIEGNQGVAVSHVLRPCTNEVSGGRLSKRGP